MMEIATIARPYTEALFRVAKKEDLSEWAILVQQLAELGAHEDVQRMASNPKLTKAQVTYTLLSLVKSSENKEELRNFIEVLVENDRINLLPEIGVQFQELKNASEGIADAKIVSAFPMDDGQLQEALRDLEKRFSVKLRATEVTVDNSLIGGIIVTVGDEVLDLSVRAKLQNMYETLVS
ncbi:F0F1 ATP synthase subunit delta [Oxalobacter sp. OttesenSCG-928-P03]|nr:F0F1 ATP synthase subunit delta [Oxalobacter sp. OttesenSCG-928-P03]